MWQGQRVCVGVPGYNEEAGSGDAGTHLRALDAAGAGPLLAPTTSRTKPAPPAQEAGARVVGESRQASGHALRRGLAEAQGEYVVLAEPDGTFMAKDVLKLL